jgi:crotonobetainyl-CoA:carnitine CoA-transferase CaiB-like acyl-CoA transferase
VAFAGERLLSMRNEEIITAIIAKARAATDETKKAQFVGLLARMNEPCVPVMRFRECLPDEQLQELYQRLVVPALAELQPK